MSQYLVTTVWWPDGWEPRDPLDVPNCLGKAQQQVPNRPMTFEQAVAMVRGLNRQNMDHPGALWHVVGAISDDQTAGETVDAARVQVVLPENGGARGDCTHCPAREFPCAATPDVHRP